ncbi:MAG: DegT/DnrJ/EryC1/StrS aminotransferase family protein [Chitinophagaceae bacterium]|nr:DegT/DnrJ/EryC1/StrS aminotransferase family protein [Chitinophagaceae bacterium]
MQFIPLGKPDITDKDIEAVVTVLKSGMLIQGENILALEKSFADFHNVSHAIAVSNGPLSIWH